MKALKISDLHFSYTQDPLLKNVNFEVPKGSFISILGPNGCGKTTLLKNLSKTLHPKSGNIQVMDKSIKAYGQKEFAKTIAVVQQSQPNDFDFTVEEVVMMGRYPHLKLLQNEGIGDHEIVESALKRTATTHLREKNFKHISGGERQRVMIARALAQQTDTLFLDEPISHLDIKYQLEILHLCQTLSHEKQMTIVTTLHDINMAARFSDYIILMKQGEIVAMGTPSEVITAKAIQTVYDVAVHVGKLEGGQVGSQVGNKQHINVVYL